MDLLHECYDAAVMEASGHVQMTLLVLSIIRQTCRKPVLLGDLELENFAVSNRAAARSISDGQLLSEFPVREIFWPSRLGVERWFYSIIL
jgi:hypothetical protein